ncbi:hypothetical protein BYT27DRAFT_7203845 [Phlegmacium glaucopus]|nr:hypothetical protein BYT27DRAFT_7203845 [Phlegmacium glaucopus]
MELDNLNRPRQCHPLLLSKRRLDGTEWKSQTTWNNKKRKLDNDHLPRESDRDEPHATEGVLTHFPNNYLITHKLLMHNSHNGDGHLLLWLRERHITSHSQKRDKL